MNFIDHTCGQNFKISFYLFLEHSGMFLQCFFLRNPFTYVFILKNAKLESNLNLFVIKYNADCLFLPENSRSIITKRMLLFIIFSWRYSSIDLFLVSQSWFSMIDIWWNTWYFKSQIASKIIVFWRNTKRKFTLNISNI